MYSRTRRRSRLPRYVPPDPKAKSKHLIFCEIYKGELDPYRGEAVTADSQIAEYLKGSDRAEGQGRANAAGLLLQVL